MQSWYFLIFWTVGVILIVVFNGPVLAKMCREKPQEGETREEARQRRRCGLFLVAGTVLGVIGGYAMILFIFPRVLSE